MKELEAKVRREIKSVYSTDMSVMHSETEFRLTFFDTWLSRDAPGGRIQQEKDVVAEIILSPKHFKTMLDVLKRNLELYERSYGKIEPPKNRVEIEDIQETDRGYV